MHSSWCLLFFIVCTYLIGVRGDGIFQPITMGSYGMHMAPVQLSCPHDNSNLEMMDVVSADLVNISISAGRKILLRPDAIMNGYTINRITVEKNSSLIFDDANMTLHVREIIVLAGGHLLIGSESCRVASNITIVFHGSKADSSMVDDITGTTSKGLIAYGNVDIHGALFMPTWTRLYQTASQGSSVIELRDRVNWRVGHTILLTTTVMFDCPDRLAGQWCEGNGHQNEERRIIAIAESTVSDGVTLTVDTPLAYDHFSSEEYQGEVALLDRNIALIGEESGDSFGGHTKVAGALSHGRFSGVRGTNMGQLNVLGRYPFHFHLLGDASDPNGATPRPSYFKDCLVTHSNFRCFVVHGTNHTTLSSNMAYNVNGSCVYLEDGVEEHNLLEYNLVSHVHPVYQPADGGYGQEGETFTAHQHLLNPADTSASGYYIANAMNKMIGNAASGGWSGFVFPNLPTPLGAYRNTIPKDSKFNPFNRPLDGFIGNSAHSSGFYWRGHGSCMYVGGWLAHDASNSDILTYVSGRKERTTYNAEGEQTFMKFENLNVFLCIQGLAHWGKDVQVTAAEFHDTMISAQLFGEATISHSLINRESSNPNGQVKPWNDKIGFGFYDTWVKTILYNVTFRNIAGCALRYLDHSDHYTPQGINAVQRLRFEQVLHTVCIDNCGADCGTEHTTMSSKIYSVWDFDGSLTGTGQPSILGSNSDWWNLFDGCSQSNVSHLWQCPWHFSAAGIGQHPNETGSIPDSIPEHTIGYMTLSIPGLVDDICDSSLFSNCTDQYAPYTVGRVSHWGAKAGTRGISMSPWPGVSGGTNMGWYWRSRSPVHGVDGAPSHFSVARYHQLARGSFVVLAIAYPPSTTFEVNLSIYGLEIPSLHMSSLDAVLSLTENLLAPEEMDCSMGAGEEWWYMCKDTGAVGPAWHFDGTHLYLRVVPFGCYNINRHDICEMHDFAPFGAAEARVWENSGLFDMTVNAVCDGCVVQSMHNNVTYYEVPDIAPSLTLAEHHDRTSSPTLYAPIFSDGFESLDETNGVSDAGGWSVFEELVTECYIEGVGGVYVSGEAKYEGSSGLVVAANSGDSLYSNHVIAHKTVQLGVYGLWKYSVWGMLPDVYASTSQVGPEFSVQNTRVKNGTEASSASSTTTAIAGIQYVASTYFADKWNIWVDVGDGSASAAWETLNEDRWDGGVQLVLQPGVWYEYVLHIDYDNNEYVSLTVNEAETSTAYTADLTGIVIAAELRNFAVATVVTLEAENLYSNCGTAGPFQSKVYYDKIRFEEITEKAQTFALVVDYEFSRQVEGYSDRDVVNWDFNIYAGNFGSSDNAYFVKDNANVTNGQFILSITNESNGGRAYSTAGLGTWSHFAQIYGKWEVEARFPRGFGVTGYIGLFTSDKAWPPEVDFAELIGRDPSSLFLTQHFGNSSSHHKAGDVVDWGVDWTDEFHVYGIEWTPAAAAESPNSHMLRYYIDGHLVLEQQAEFEQQLMDVAIGTGTGNCGSWVNCPENANANEVIWPSQMTINYVRIYNYSTQQSTAPSTGPTSSPTHMPGYYAECTYGKKKSSDDMIRQDYSFKKPKSYDQCDEVVSLFFRPDCLPIMHDDFKYSMNNGKFIVRASEGGKFKVENKRVGYFDDIDRYKDFMMDACRTDKKKLLDVLIFNKPEGMHYIVMVRDNKKGKVYSKYKEETWSGTDSQEKCGSQKFDTGNTFHTFTCITKLSTK